MEVKKVNNNNSAISKQEKKRVLYCVIQSNAICATMFLNITSFYPLYAQQTFGKQMTTTKIAIAMSAFELSGIIASPFVPSLLAKIGRKNAVLVS